MGDEHGSCTRSCSVLIRHNHDSVVVLVLDAMRKVLARSFLNSTSSDRTTWLITVADRPSLRHATVSLTRTIDGCWIGSVLGFLPWAASLEPQGPDVYTRNFQCCMFIPINCGHRYVRIQHTSTFKATDEDIEVFTSERWINFRPTPGCGIRIC